MRIVLLGAPGSGKGTQAQRLGDRFGVPKIATGDMLRAAIAGGEPLGEEVRTYMAAGALVADDVMLALVDERLRKEDAERGFVLDGFPRSLPQADGLERLLSVRQAKLDRVIKLDVSRKALLERMTSRRICPGCGAIYNLLTEKPTAPDTCNRCGHHLVQREDDSEVTVKRRLNVYESATAPLIDYYDQRHLLSIVNGEGSAEEVGRRVLEVMERSSGAAGA